MNDAIHEHIQEYRAQQEQLKRQLAALEGAIQALERLQKNQEAKDGSEENR